MIVGILTLLAIAQAPAASTPPRPCPVAPAIARTADGTVMGAIGAADANEIEAATLATTKAKSAEVRAFATMLLHDHELSLIAGTNLSKQYNIVRLLPADSAMARTHVAEMLALNTQSGDAFDKSFVQLMVDNHKSGIETVNKKLLPLATRAQVKTYARQRIPVLRMHQAAGEKWLAAHP